MNNNLVVFSSGYNCENYVKNHIESIHNQLYQNFKHIIIDDASTDDTYNKLQKLTKNYNNVLLYRNTDNKGEIFNIIEYLKANDDDIIVIIDLDDWLASPEAFNIINTTYNDYNCWMTYSRMFYNYSKKTSHWIKPYSRDIIENKKFRESIWSFTHLRTYKYFLLKHINEEDLKDNNDNYFKSCTDQALLLPMLEMSSPNKIQFIDDVLYVYNDKNPLNVHKVNKNGQKNNREIIRNKKKYQSLTKI